MKAFIFSLVFVLIMAPAQASKRLLENPSYPEPKRQCNYHPSPIDAALLESNIDLAQRVLEGDPDAVPRLSTIDTLAYRDDLSTFFYALYRFQMPPSIECLSSLIVNGRDGLVVALIGSGWKPDQSLVDLAAENNKLNVVAASIDTFKACPSNTALGRAIGKGYAALVDYCSARCKTIRTTRYR